MTSLNSDLDLDLWGFPATPSPQPVDPCAPWGFLSPAAPPGSTHWLIRDHHGHRAGRRLGRRRFDRRTDRRHQRAQLRLALGRHPVDVASRFRIRRPERRCRTTLSTRSTRRARTTSTRWAIRAPRCPAGGTDRSSRCCTGTARSGASSRTRRSRRRVSGPASAERTSTTSTPSLRTTCGSPDSGSISCRAASPRSPGS